MKFQTDMRQVGNNTGIEVPEEIVTALGAGKKPPVTLTLNGSYAYRSTIAVMDGAFMIPFSADHREKSGIAGGDAINVEIALDTAPRTVEVPPDFAEALAQDVAARESWNSLSYSNQRRHALSIEGAKSPETRQRRIDKTIVSLREGKK
jgi:hypothetical protein